jgi:hypothetical protein
MEFTLYADSCKDDLFAPSPDRDASNNDDSLTQLAPERTVKVVTKDFEEDPESVIETGIIAVETKPDGRVELVLSLTSSRR